MNKKIAVLALVGMLSASGALARDFDSVLKLKVFLREAGDVPDHVIGFTPAREGRLIHIPEGRIWYVRPIGPLSGIQLDELARAMKGGEVPGLDLSDHWELSNESLRHLASLSHLRMLDVSRTRISDAGIRELKPFTRLSILILPSGITDRAAEDLRQMQSLQELGLDETRLTDRGLARIVHLAALETLDLSSTQVTDEGLAELQKCPNLRRLTLGGLITDAGAVALGKLKSLREIDISQTRLGEEGLAALALLPRLRSVSLGRGVTDRGLARLSASSSLKALDLSRTPVTDEGVKSVARIKSLEELALTQTSIGDDSLIALAQMPELRILDLSDTHASPAGLAPLAHLRKLEVLSLSWQTLTREDLQSMSRLKQVRTIVLNGVPIPEATMVKLRRLSPWEPVAGLGTGRVHESLRADPLAMALPISIPLPGLKAGTLPEIPRTSASPLSPASQANPSSAEDQPASSRAAFHSGDRNGPAMNHVSLRRPAEESAVALLRPEPIASLKAARATISPDTSTLKDAGTRPALPASGGDHTAQAAAELAPAALSAPAEVASRGEADNLLQTIRLQSNPARAGTFSGLSGMRQLRRTETLASLDRLSTDSAPSAASTEENEPTQSLGEISVGVVGQRRK